ncbi:MAG: PAS domain S-box protein [Bacteroidetes bacterium]|nr:PAS domain S-box protein [Bacteroidota bacterium]
MPTQSNLDFIKVSDSDGVSVDIRFSSIVEWINEGVFCVNSDGKILYANDQFCRNLGFTKIELIGKNILDYFYNEDFVRLSKQKLEMRKKGLSDVYEIKMRKKNGEGIWIRVNGKPVFNSEGKFVCSVGIHIDITKQKELEEELIFAKEDLESRVITRTRQLSEANAKLNQQMKERKMAEVSLVHSEKRFRDIYINSPDAIYVESHDGIILDLNEATCKLHNTTADNLLGKSIYDISPVSVHPEIRKRQPKIISGEITKFESECLTESGQVLPIEISVAPITFKDKPALLMHVRDISDRKKHQHLLQKLNEELEEKVRIRTQEIEETKAELEKQKAFLSQIIDASPGLVFVKDLEGKYLLINQTMADYYNISKSEMLGKRDEDFHFSHGDLELFKAQDKDVIEKGGEVSFPEQAFVNSKTGEKTWLSVVKKVIPSIDNKGKIYWEWPLMLRQSKRQKRTL